MFLVNAIVADDNNDLRDQEDVAHAVPQSAYHLEPLEDLNDSGFLDGLDVSSSSSATKRRVFSKGHSFIFDRSSNGFSETMGYYYLDYAQRRDPVPGLYKRE